MDVKGEAIFMGQSVPTLCDLCHSRALNLVGDFAVAFKLRPNL